VTAASPSRTRSRRHHLYPEFDRDGGVSIQNSIQFFDPKLDRDGDISSFTTSLIQFSIQKEIMEKQLSRSRWSMCG